MSEKSEIQICPRCGEQALRWCDVVTMLLLDAAPVSLDRFACYACGMVTFFDLAVLHHIVEHGYEPPAPAQ